MLGFPDMIYQGCYHNNRKKQELSKFVSFLSWFEEATKVVVCNWQVPFAEESLSIVGLVCCCCHLRFRKQLSDSWGDGGQGLNCIFAFLSSTVYKFDFQKSKEGIERSNRSNKLKNRFIDCQHQLTSCPWLLCILSLNRRNQPHKVIRDMFFCEILQCGRVCHASWAELV